MASIIKGAQKYCDDVIVVDDCSQDGTGSIAADLGARCVRHFANRGQGAATRTGVFIAAQLGADVIVTLDSDGQHDPEQIPLLLAPLAHDNSIDIVIGSRFKGNGDSVPAYRRFGIHLLTMLYNTGSRQRLSDALLCFRAFRSVAIRDISIQEDGFGFCPEMLIKARHKGLKIKEVPIRCKYHDEYERNSAYGPVKLATILAWKILLWRIRVEH